MSWDQSSESIMISELWSKHSPRLSSRTPQNREKAFGMCIKLTFQTRVRSGHRTSVSACAGSIRWPSYYGLEFCCISLSPCIISWNHVWEIWRSFSHHLFEGLWSLSTDQLHVTEPSFELFCLPKSIPIIPFVSSAMTLILSATVISLLLLLRVFMSLCLYLLFLRFVRINCPRRTSIGAFGQIFSNSSFARLLPFAQYLINSSPISINASIFPFASLTVLITPSVFQFDL
jgi:hypothetical protein